MGERFSYQWTHTPTGESGTKTEEFLCRMAFLEQLNSWNKLGNGVWIYWEVANG